MRYKPGGKVALISVFIFSLGAVLACMPALSSELPENPAGGSTVFVEKTCLHCHAIQGYGGSEGPDLGRLELKGGFLGMAGIMWNHAPRMIAALARDRLPFPKFTTAEMTQLVAFLYTLNYLDPSGNARRGEETFTAKGCISCHSVGGKGGVVGPPLDGYGKYVSPLFVATALWNKGPAMAEAMERLRIPRPTLSGREVRDIVSFLRTRARRESGKPSRILIQPGNPTNGAKLFVSKKCADCHALRNGKQKGRIPLARRNFKVSLSAISSRMWNHGPSMWAQWNSMNLTPISLIVEEMADITAYLYFLQFESPPGDIEEGASLFKSRGCAECHEPNESGERNTALKKEKEDEAPDLRTKGPWKNEIDLVREMWNHAGKMYQKLLESPQDWPKLNEQEVAHILAYVRTIGGTKSEEKN